MQSSYSDDILKRCKNAGVSDNQIIKELSKSYDSAMDIIKTILERDVAQILLSDLNPLNDIMKNSLLKLNLKIKPNENFNRR